MQRKKRQSPLKHAQLEVEFGKRAKRCRREAGTDCWLDALPSQPQQELGPFWATNGCLCSLQQRLQSADAATCSLGSWCDRQQASLSLAQRSTSRACADTEDEDTQDTATSSGSEGCERPQQQRAPTRKPRTAATGEEDSITSNQPVPCASVAFSFGSRPYLVPDLTGVQCWDVMNDLLAAV